MYFIHCLGPSRRPLILPLRASIRRGPRAINRPPDDVPSRCEVEGGDPCVGEPQGGRARWPPGQALVSSWPTNENRTRSLSSTRSPSLCGGEVACRKRMERYNDQGAAREDRTDTGTVLLKVIAGRLGDYCEREREHFAGGTVDHTSVGF